MQRGSWSLSAGFQMLSLPHSHYAILGVSLATPKQLLGEHLRVRAPAFQGYGSGEMS